jgi:hypothetical protein
MGCLGIGTIALTVAASLRMLSRISSASRKYYSAEISESSVKKSPSSMRILAFCRGKGSEYMSAMSKS